MEMYDIRDQELINRQCLATLQVDLTEMGEQQVDRRKTHVITCRLSRMVALQIAASIKGNGEVPHDTGEMEILIGRGLNNSLTRVNTVDQGTIRTQQTDIT